METQIGQLRRALQDLEEVAKTSQGRLSEVDPDGFAAALTSISDAVEKLPKARSCPVSMASFNALQLLTQVITSSSDITDAALRLQACQVLGFLFTSPTSGAHNAAATHAWMLRVLRATNPAASLRPSSSDIGKDVDSRPSTKPSFAENTPEITGKESNEVVGSLAEGSEGKEVVAALGVDVDVGIGSAVVSLAPRQRRTGEDYSGVLMGATQDSDTEHTDPPRLGYQLPRMWFPRQLRAALQENLGEFDRELEAVDEDWRVEEKGGRRSVREKMVKVRQTLPKKYLLEQGLEVAYCRQFMRVTFTKLFGHCELLLMRGALSRWKFKLRAAKYDAFKRRAGADKLKWVMKRHLATLLPRVWAQWLAAAEAIYKEQQYAGATALQKVCRGVAGRVKFAIHKRRWMACRSIQKEWRRFACVRTYQRCRTAAIEIQRQVRGYQIRLLVRKWHACATLIQSVVRMQPPLRYFVLLKVAVLLAQPRIRRAIAQRVFYDELRAFYEQVNRQVASAVRIQRIWHIFTAARTATAQREQQLLELNAALSLQRSWYRHKDQMAAYVLMRAIVVEEERGKVEIILEKRHRRRQCATTIQCFLRAKTAQATLQSRRLRYLSARAIQANARRFIYRKRCERLRIVHDATIVIQRLFRAKVLPYHTASYKIQKACLQHLASMRKCRTQRVYAAFVNDEAVKNNQGVNVLLRLARCMLARREVRRRRSCAALQRWVRGCLGYKRAARKAKSIHDTVVDRHVSGLVREVRDTLAMQIAIVRTKSALKLQGMWRRRKAQKHMVALRKTWKYRSRAALRIQCFLRTKNAERAAKTLRLRRRNGFKSVTCAKSVAVKVMLQASKLYDPFDPLAGVHIAEFLFKLHLTHAYEKLQGIGMEALLRCSADNLWEAGIIREEEVQVLLAAFGAATAIENIREDWLNNKRSRFGVNEVGQPQRTILQAMQPITTDEELLQAYLQHFPAQLTRAQNFKSKIPLGTVNTIQLHSHLHKYQGRPKEAKDYVGEILEPPPDQQLKVKAWNRERVRRTYKLYMMAVERMEELIPPSFTLMRGALSQARAMAELPGATAAERGCRCLRIAVNMVFHCSTAAITIQKHWRRWTHRKRFIETILRLRYLEEVRNGASLKRRWKKEKELEERAWRAYHKELLEEQIREHLAHITRYGWDQAHDDSGSLYYWHAVTGNMQWDRPVYSVEEHYASQRIINFARVIVAKQEASWVRQLMQRAEALERKRMAWEAEAEGRENLATVRLDVKASKRLDPCLTVRDEELARIAQALRAELDRAGMCVEDARAPAAERVESLRPWWSRKHLWLHSPTDVTNDSGEDTEISIEVEMRVEDHLSLTAEMRHFEQTAFPQIQTFNSVAFPTVARLQQEASAAALIQSLIRRRIAKVVTIPLRHLELKEAAARRLEQSVEDFQNKRARMRLQANVAIQYSKVELPFGWEEVDGEDGEDYYFNADTNQTQWEKPQYVWDENLSSITLQRIIRGYIGKKAVARHIVDLDVCKVALSGITKAEAIGWAGHDPNGLTVEMWFARQGLHYILSNHRRKRENRFQRACSKPLQLPWIEDSLKAAFITDQEHVEVILAQQEEVVVQLEPGYEVRGDAMVCSEEDVVRHFLALNRDQPARATRFAQRLRETSTPITYFQLQAHLQKYRGQPSLAITQIPTELANLPTLPSNETVLRICQSLQRTCGRLALILRKKHVRMLEEVLNTALAAEVTERTAPGPWFMMSPPLDVFCVCQLREALVSVIEACRKVERIQRIWRSFWSLKQWRAYAYWLRSSATIIQCAWRCYAARTEARRLEAMKASVWEELLDAERDALYYFNNETKASQWTAPDVPFKPLDYWPIDPSTLPAPPGICDHCRTAEALRVCLVCVNIENMPKEFCFKCFGVVHGDDAELINHGFHVLGGEESLKHKKAPCARCGGPCIRECNDCDELYCMACYRRVHAKGKRRAHTWIKYAQSPYLCVECEEAIARVHCKTCDDMYCFACSKKFHRLGKRATHEVEEITYEIKNQGQGK